MSFFKLILTNLRRHRVRVFFGVAGIAFGVAAMLTVLAVVLGAIGMFRNILETDSQYMIFERNVSDLFFSSVPEASWQEVAEMPEVASAQPVLFGIVNSPGHPVVTCFGVDSDNARVDRATWLSGERLNFGREANTVSLTKHWNGKLIAIIVSGYDGDGAEALCGIKEVGGITIAQKPDTAVQPDMPESAIASGCIDFILSPEDIAKEIIRIANTDIN